MKLFSICLAAGAALIASAAAAKDIPVQMLNSGPGGAMVFSPSLIKASVGDTVRFIAAPSHNAELIPGMAPAGVPVTAGKMNQGFDLKIAKAGVYGVRCKPHFAMGMVALIKAGKGTSENLVSAKAAKMPGLAAKRMTALLSQVE